MEMASDDVFAISVDPSIIIEDVLVHSYNLISKFQSSAKSSEDVCSIFDEHLEEVSGLAKNFKFPNFNPNCTWFNTDSVQYQTIEEVDSKIVVLDFFTYCCINCIHVFSEIHQLESVFTNSQDVSFIGIHSAKFENEKLDESVQHAVTRNRLTHPVVNDGDATLWNQLGINCWPTLLIIVDGKLTVVLQGEGHVELLQNFFKYILLSKKSGDNYFQTETKESNPQFLPLNPRSGCLRFPSKLCICQDSTLFISDTCNHRILECEQINSPNEWSVRRIIGGSSVGHSNGTIETSTFNYPQGLCKSGDVIYVADTSNHTIRYVNVVENTVGNVDTRGVEIKSPWDVCMGKSQPDLPSNDALFVACAGSHQIFVKCLSDTVWFECHERFRMESKDGDFFALAGNGKEENRNNWYRLKAGFAQPSSIVYSTLHHSLFIADAESSSIRQIDLRSAGEVRNVCGGSPDPTNLFCFGDVDGIGMNVKLQHPLAVITVDDTLLIADSYNHKLKSVEKLTSPFGQPSKSPVKSKAQCRTIEAKSKLNEPGGLAIDPANRYVLIADTNNHCIKKMNLDSMEIKEIEINFSSFTEPISRNSTEVQETQHFIMSFTKRELVKEQISMKFKFTMSNETATINLDAPNPKVEFPKIGENQLFTLIHSKFDSNENSLVNTYYVNYEHLQTHEFTCKAVLYLCDCKSKLCYMKNAKFSIHVKDNIPPGISETAPIDFEINLNI